MTFTPQQKRIIDYLRIFGSITTLDGFAKLGIVCVPKRMQELSKKGFPVTKRRITVRNRYEENVTVIEYSINFDQKGA